MSLEKKEKTDIEKYLFNGLLILIIVIFPTVMLILGYLFWSNDNGTAF